ncbi:hypothetical protein I3760_13G017400 [Carya illinoinensis]|nr:hypothetical protein I3760_13G017400 [Carya illinoinensis]
MRMQAGEIVWTRVVFPQKWWPGLVLRADALGVLVSFFDLQPPRYFFDSQVRPFEDNFRSLSCSTSDALLERALRLFGRRTLWSLTCPCRRGKKNSRGCFQAAAAAATSFQAVGVLGFILSRAVSPWIEEADFVDAVRVLAQIQAFRGYSSGNQRLRYKRYDQRGSEDENSVAHETDNLEVQGESQLFFMEVENNLAAGVTKIANSGLSVVKGSFDERDHDSMSQARIKQWKANSLDASISAPLSGPSFKLQVAMSAFQLNGSGAYLKRKHNGFEIDRFNAPFPISPIKLKIKHHSASGPQSFTYLCNSSFVELVLDMFSISPSEEASHHGDNVEICKLQEPAKNVDINTKPCISCVERQELGKCVCNWENNGVQDEDVGVDSNLRSLQPLATQSVSNHVIGTHAKSTEVDSGLAAKSGLIADIIKKLPGDGAIFNRSNECASINLALGDSFNEHKELYRPVISNSSFGSQRGRQLEALAASTSLHMKFPRLFKLPSKEELVKVFCPFGPVDTLKTRISSWTGAAQVVFSHPNDAVAAYQYAKEKITLFGKANIRFWLDPLEHRRRGTKNSVPSPSMTGKSVNQKSCRSVSSTSSIKSQRGEKLEATTSATASTLHMKFPKDFKLPSKEELLKKFCPFHTVDSQRTKVFFNTGAAQVVFSDPTDAVAAYQYAKKKVLFGDTNIRFWLDPLEHKRRGTMFSAPSPSMTGKPVNRKLCPPVSSTSSFKSQGGEQLEELAPGTAFTALHMKFSNNSKPPSKQELIKKFSPFGTIDSTKTKVFSCTGAAQVVFLNPTDAVAAYQYAKKKRVLSSEANVRFWVDALEHRKRGTKVPVSPRELTGKPVNLKSCLKKSSPPEHRDQKKPYNVRFIIQA